MLNARGACHLIARARSLWLLIVLLAFIHPVYTERLPVRTYNTSDGLAHITVYRIVKDSSGFLWFCTGGGLSRFDGYSFTTFSVEQGLPHAIVYDVLETPEGKYWVATGDGLAHFDPDGTPGSDRSDQRTPLAQRRMFTAVAPSDEHRRARTMTVLYRSDDGTVWAGSNRGLYRLVLAGGLWSLEPVEIGLPNDSPEAREIVDLLEDAHSSLWIATPSGLYRRWTDGTAARYGVRDGFPAEFLSDLYKDRRGQLWVSSRDRGFFQLHVDGTRRPPAVVKAFDEKHGLQNNWVNQVYEASDHRFWIATGMGLVEYFDGGETPERRFRSFTTRHGLAHNFVKGITEDRAGNIWLSTHQAGAMKIVRGGFTTFGDADGVESISAMFEDSLGNLCFKGVVPGEVLASQHAGARPEVIAAIRGRSHQRYGCLSDSRLEWITPEGISSWGWVLEGVTLQARSGEWWLGQVGLFRFPPSDRFMSVKNARPKNIYRHADGLAMDQIFRLFQDKQDRIWVSTTSSTASGLARWDPRTDRLHDLGGLPGLPALTDDTARAFAEDADGRIWIAFNGGLARYTNDQFRFFTSVDGLPSGVIAGILVDRTGRIWLASRSSGLIRVDHPGRERPEFVRYTTAQGLSSNDIEVIEEDSAGRLYVGGGYGIDRFEPHTGRIKHFGSAEGLPPGQLYTAFRDRHGVMWFGLSNGLARLDPAPASPPNPPPILITACRVAGLPRPVSALGEHEMSLADLAADENQLQVEFVALGFDPGEILRYQYRLEGAGGDWSALADQRTVTFASLAPGRYRFAVRAVNSDGIASLRPASIAFTILRPVWQRWWFVLLATIVLGLSVHALYRRRVARLLEIANMRTHIATDLHDDIGANLTRIALLSEVASRTRAEAPLASIATIARESVSSMSDIVWAINPKRESLLELTRRMRQHAEEVFTLRDIALRFHAPDSAESLKLGMDVRRDLLLIFKEAVNNAARHSGCSAVEIDLHVSGSRLVLKVSDNGAGFDASKESDGQGLTSMQRRARRLGGTLDVTTSPGLGTIVTVDAPI